MFIKRDGSLAAGATLNPNNLWAGSAFEYLPGPSFISIGLVTPAAAGGLLSAMYVGGALIGEEYQVPTDNRGAAAGASALASDDFWIVAAGGANQRLVNTLRNPTGGALTYSGIAVITPTGGGRRRR